jgi:arylsulfatase A-like enzyme
VIFGEEELAAIRAGRLVLAPWERRYVADLYDGGVAHADRVIGGFLETLRREGVLDRAILMVISDHGEELWERYPNQSPGHGHSLYQEIQHVPWLVRAPGIVPAGLRLRAPVSLLDLSPTLQELTGLSWDADQQGGSLARSLRGGATPEGESILMESVEYGPDRFAMRSGDFKVILTPSPDQANSGVAIPAPPLQVFDLAADPGERHDLSGRMDDLTRRMAQALYERSRHAKRPSGARPGEADLPPDLRRQIESLGYVR